MLKKIKELDKSSFEWKLLLIGKINPQVMESYLDKLTATKIQKLIEDELSKKNQREKIIIPIVRTLKWLAMLISLGLCVLLAYRLLMRMEEVIEAIQYHIFLLVFAIVFILIVLILLNAGLFLLHQSLIRSIKNKEEKIEFMDKYLKFKLKKIRETNCVSD